ncbi:MAG: hypothetical protein AVDCRST_MAG31-1604 [uncultured Sphingomonas sp.]|uniref:Uncharacterized protein n=1 Tax=uncultured Sphingomonas sp. TaxID=158754 RepID=A0A6J4TGN7_9SPHN|nr:MAG: hypothetical protein AVDCRST_MAG31-1604 [uncultured Sphingomonas sp.]
MLGAPGLSQHTRPPNERALGGVAAGPARGVEGWPDSGCHVAQPTAGRPARARRHPSEADSAQSTRPRLADKAGCCPTLRLPLTIEDAR